MADYREYTAIADVVEKDTGKIVKTLHKIRKIEPIVDVHIRDEIIRELLEDKSLRSVNKCDIVSIVDYVSLTELPDNYVTLRVVL